MSGNRLLRSYSELKRLDTFEDRFAYLHLGGLVGRETFGFDRYINQMFYTSDVWKKARRTVIIRDQGCDLGIFGHEIHSGLLVHHMNPMTPDDIVHEASWITDPEYLITTRHDTHNAIHFSDSDAAPGGFVERAPGDTKLW